MFEVSAVKRSLLPLEDPGLRLLYDYWKSKCGGRRMPTRGDIDVLDVRPVAYSGLCEGHYVEVCETATPSVYDLH